MMDYAATLCSCTWHLFCESLGCDMHENIQKGEMLSTGIAGICFVCGQIEFGGKTAEQTFSMWAETKLRFKF